MYLSASFTSLFALFKVTRGGMYLLNLVDESVSHYPLLIIALLELFVINYVYGYQQFYSDIQLMLGKRYVKSALAI